MSTPVGVSGTDDLHRSRFEIDWDGVHESVQAILEGLTHRVIAEVPLAKWKIGRCAGGVVSLFSYRIFYHLDGDDYDPVIVGVTSSQSGSEIRISGDISGDESGYLYFFDEGCERVVVADSTSIRGAAEEVARRLASRPDVIIGAIRDRHPEAMPR